MDRDLLSVLLLGILPPRRGEGDHLLEGYTVLSLELGELPVSRSLPEWMLEIKS